MKNYPIRRIALLAALMAGALTGMTAQADPLPAPAEPKGGGGHEGPPPVVLLMPAADANVTYDTLFAWKNPETPNKYILRLLIVATGETVKFNVPLDACADGGACGVAAGATPLFDHVKDGAVIQWRVIAKYDDGTSKSAKRLLRADTVNAPETLFPADDAMLLPVHNLTWNHSDANESYVVTIIDVETGELTAKFTVLHGDCGATCAISPQITAQNQQQEYRWFVKAKGFNGNKAKSAKQMFTTPALAAAT
jgi:hypothetical protein